MTIGEKIKLLRINKNLTQEDLATAVKTTKQTIHKYENGIISNIPASKIKLIADKLNTTPAYLMGWEDESNHNSLKEYNLTRKEIKCINIYRKLNKLGKQKADEYITDLLYNPKYTANDE